MLDAALTVKLDPVSVTRLDPVAGSKIPLTANALLTVILAASVVVLPGLIVTRRKLVGLLIVCSVPEKTTVAGSAVAEYVPVLVQLPTRLIELEVCVIVPLFRIARSPLTVKS